MQWEGRILGDIFSFAISAEGAVNSPRPAFVWTGGNIDLQTGAEITWEDLFLDAEAARETMETWLDAEVAPELSAHLLNSQLTPVPDLFRMTERGMLLLYPSDQLSTLSDRAGDVLIPWNVVQDQLRTEEGGLPKRIGVWKQLDLDEQSAERLTRMAEAGAIPGIPVSLGDSLQALTDEHHLLIDPDLDASGRLFSLEGGSFWSVFLMTDDLSESWENSRVEGIRVDIGSVSGLTIGETEQAAWRQALGEPDHTIDFDAERAEAYRTVPGTRDYYELGGHRLQLHGDENGLLASIILSE